MLEKNPRWKTNCQNTFYIFKCEVYKGPRQEGHRLEIYWSWLSCAGDKLNCDLCMVTCCTEEQLRIHIAGKKHQSKSRSQSQSIFTCSVCNITTTDQNGLDMHLNGKSHQAMLRRGGYTRPYHRWWSGYTRLWWGVRRVKHTKHQLLVHVLSLHIPNLPM